MQHIETDTICNFQFTTTLCLTGTQARQLIEACYAVHYSPLNCTKKDSPKYIDEDRRKELSKSLYRLLTLPIGTKVTLNSVKAVDEPDYDSYRFDDPNLSLFYTFSVYSNETDTPRGIASLFLNSNGFRCFESYMLEFWFYAIGKGAYA